MTKHIAFFVSSLNVGGVERAFVNLANSFVVQGHKVDFIVCQEMGELRSELYKSINIIDFKDSRLRKSFLNLYKYIKGSSADCLISGPTYPNIVALFANFLSFNKMKIIVSQHSYQDIEMKNLGLVGKLAPFLIKKTYNYASKVVCVSEGLANDMVTNYNVKPEKISIIYNAVLDKGFFIKAQEEQTYDLFDRKYIIGVGRLAVVKNYPFILNAFSKMKASMPDFDYELVILGKGEEKENLKALAKELSVEKYVHFMGAIVNPLPLIKNASLFIHTSYSEAMPLVYVEALALKVPVVTINNSGAEEILEGVKPKIIVDSHDQEKFISAIVKMLDTKFDEGDFPELNQFKSERIRDLFLEII